MDGGKLIDGTGRTEDAKRSRRDRRNRRDRRRPAGARLLPARPPGARHTGAGGPPRRPCARRVRGLRREELAQLAGISVDYYVRLEQGRATQPSPEVLDALAGALGLDAAERGHLGTLVGARRGPAPRAGVSPLLRRILNSMGRLPRPS
ncbi:helix-turn-helix transcriptional regulator [Streptomyces radiopugnans]|nr:helix-turn-helix transcriptional regulator [Streptomyces radiopugnans]